MKHSKTNFIHPTSIVEDGVIMGENNYIGPFCYIKKGVVIGNDNRFEAYCSIGTPAEHKEYFTNEECFVTIGNKNTFREYVTINAGTKEITYIKNNIIMLRGSHVGHDVTIEDNVTLSCNVLIGGHSHIMEGANMGLGAICHQFSVIGAYSMVGMGSVVTKTGNIIPGGIFVGSPSKYIHQNKIGLDRNNISFDILTELRSNYYEIKSSIKG